MKRFLIMFIAIFMPMAAQLTLAADSGDAAEFVEFAILPDEDTSSDCTQRGGMRVFVINAHPDATIDLQIDRFFSDVRQAGRSMFALASGHRQPLGCNTVMDSEQRWELVRAVFIDDEKAKNRYGQIN
jgi:hypothetical protein